MKLITYNETNIRSGVRSDKCVISISLKGGAIRFSRKLAEILGLEKNKIVIAQDSDRPQDWFIQVDNSDAGIAVRLSTKTKAGQWIIQSAKVVRLIATSCKLDLSGGGYTFQVSDTPDDDGLYAIITRSAK